MRTNGDIRREDKWTERLQKALYLEDINEVRRLTADETSKQASKQTSKDQFN